MWRLVAPKLAKAPRDVVKAACDRSLALISNNLPLHCLSFPRNSVHRAPWPTGRFVYLASCSSHSSPVPGDMRALSACQTMACRHRTDIQWSACSLSFAIEVRHTQLNLEPNRVTKSPPETGMRPSDYAWARAPTGRGWQFPIRRSRAAGRRPESAGSGPPRRCTCTCTRWQAGARQLGVQARAHEGASRVACAWRIRVPGAHGKPFPVRAD